MKGWHNESYRHSLASRGIPTKYLHRGEYFYHGTTTGSLSGIQRRGLNPYIERKNFPSVGEDYIYLTTDAEDAEGYGLSVVGALTREMDVSKQSSVVLRMGREDIENIGGLEIDWNASTQDNIKFRLNKIIPPELIEVRDSEGNWRRLRR